MSTANKFGVKSLLATAVLAAACGGAQAAVEVAGVKFDDSLPVAGKQLVLNGAGVRTKFIIKVYAAGLYLQSRESTSEGVMKVAGPRRIRLVMLRDLTSDDFGSAFMEALNNNVSKEDQLKVMTQISKYGEKFAQIETLKKGDVLDTDWIPDVGSQTYLNGKKIGEVLPDILFYNVILRIWLGERPVDSSLKASLLAPPARK